MLNLINVYKKFTVKNQIITALDNINIKVNSGDIFGIIGKSGAGKSTLLRCVNLLERPDHGKIEFLGQDLLQLPKEQLRMARHKIGMIFQHFNLLQNLKVKANIVLPLKLQNKPSNIITSKLNNISKLTGLTKYLDHYPAQLSGGQKQRVAIARALITDPEILLCDEATSALDPKTTQDILKLLQKINKDLGVTILLISHEMEVIKTVCNKVAIISDGKIIEAGELIELCINPKEQLTKELLDISHKVLLPQSIQTGLQQIRSKLNNIAIIKLIFVSNISVTMPFISKISKDLNIELNILQGEIMHISGHIIGCLFISVKTEPSILDKLIAACNENKITIEIMGYVARIC